MRFDFAAGTDLLDFSGAGDLTGLSDLSLTDGTDGVTVSYLGNVILLEGLLVSDLTANDFIF